ncbi:MAG: ABC transporter ATP-binding protein [Muribaculaceae bacterium]|nr:ABC transporter ATP-binding protein [Roseburia sp.]MCM1432166.1 ABC transporter ATP-binding protein [Muribaculaceae bacterium]MCM1492148.1 ABC transporter ATP-binding protein [Muribaculaceae bacterium]
MLLTIENLTVKYGADTALQIHAPLQICEGDRVGIIGSNGAGKTTLIKSILGLVDYQGTIRSDLSPGQMATHMQFNEYADTMPCKYIMEAILDTKIAKNQKLQELIDYFEFGDCLRKKYSKLSGGQKQRFTIIMVMMQDMPLTFYDEVTSGLDFETRQKLMEKLIHWYAGKKSSLCIVSHYYEELEQMADKILILDKGNVIAYGKKDALFQEYCGRSVVVLDASPEHEALVKKYKKLASPAHLLALSMQSEAEEAELAGLLLRHNINYKRSNNDIEIMYSNARRAYYSKGEY